VATQPEVVDAMLEAAQVGAGDVVYDLGCGDGIIVVAAARRHGARGVCVDLDPQRIREARANAEKAGVADRITFVTGDLFATDLRPATVVTLYLSPDLNLRLRPKLSRELAPGTRVVSHDFDLGDWPPERTLEIPLSRVHRVFLWRIGPRP
jgi:ribosomal protein L11 methylase PrmA